jgi:hypothetical protein
MIIWVKERELGVDIKIILKPKEKEKLIYNLIGGIILMRIF